MKATVGFVPTPVYGTKKGAGTLRGYVRRKGRRYFALGPDGQQLAGPDRELGGPHNTEASALAAVHKAHEKRLDRERHAAKKQRRVKTPGGLPQFNFSPNVTVPDEFIERQMECGLFEGEPTADRDVRRAAEAHLIMWARSAREVFIYTLDAISRAQKNEQQLRELLDWAQAQLEGRRSTMFMHETEGSWAGRRLR